MKKKKKNIFPKCYIPSLSEEIFVIKEIKIQFHELMLLMI